MTGGFAKICSFFFWVRTSAICAAAAWVMGKWRSLMTRKERLNKGRGISGSFCHGSLAFSIFFFFLGLCLNRIGLLS